jgi:hypothetical protein
MDNTWKILGLNTNIETVNGTDMPVVKSVDWVIYCVDDLGAAGRYLGQTTLPAVTDNTTFVDFASLTFDVVKNWIDDSMNDSERNIINEALRIQCSKKGLDKQAPPWN